MVHSLGYDGDIQGAYGYGIETSKGKDTPSGHWEITGVPVMFDWGYFDRTIPCFPKELTDNFIKATNVQEYWGTSILPGQLFLMSLGKSI